MNQRPGDRPAPHTNARRRPPHDPAQGIGFVFAVRPMAGDQSGILPPKGLCAAGRPIIRHPTGAEPGRLHAEHPARMFGNVLPAPPDKGEKTILQGGEPDLPAPVDAVQDALGRLLVLREQGKGGPRRRPPPPAEDRPGPRPAIRPPGAEFLTLFSELLNELHGRRPVISQEALEPLGFFRLHPVQAGDPHLVDYLGAHHPLTFSSVCFEKFTQRLGPRFPLGSATLRSNRGYSVAGRRTFRYSPDLSTFASLSAGSAEIGATRVGLQYSVKHLH